jgi:hypothetical protein
LDTIIGCFLSGNLVEPSEEAPLLRALHSLPKMSGTKKGKQSLIASLCKKYLGLT